MIFFFPVFIAGLCLDAVLVTQSWASPGLLPALPDADQLQHFEPPAQGVRSVTGWESCASIRLAALQGTNKADVRGTSHSTLTSRTNPTDTPQTPHRALRLHEPPRPRAPLLTALCLQTAPTAHLRGRHAAGRGFGGTSRVIDSAFTSKTELLMGKYFIFNQYFSNL